MATCTTCATSCASPIRPSRPIFKKVRFQRIANTCNLLGWRLQHCAEKRPSPLLRGSEDSWAAGVVHGLERQVAPAAGTRDAPVQGASFAEEDPNRVGADVRSEKALVLSGGKSRP